MFVYIFLFRLTVDVFLLISNIGGFAVYSLFIAQNLEKVLSSASFNVHWDYRAYLLIILAPTMVLCSIRKIANLTWIMIFANCCEFYVISVVLYYYFRIPLPDIATRSVVGPVDRIPSMGAKRHPEMGTSGCPQRPIGRYLSMGA